MVEIVAEISGNHGGSLDKALTLICEAADAGCDYAKFQYYRPEDMPDRYEGDNEEMYRKLMVPDEWLPRMFGMALNCGLGLFASVFSVRAARELLKYDVPYIKLASPDSTKLAGETYYEIMAEVPADVGIVWSGLSSSWSSKVLYCPLGHPPIITKKDISNFVVSGDYWGFSDHTPGIRAPLAFIGAGARMIEKHIKLKGDNDCIDAAFSAEPNTMRLLCKLAHNR